MSEAPPADIGPAIDHFAADRVILRLRGNRGTRPATRRILVARVIRQRRRLKSDRRPTGRRKHAAPRQPWPRLGLGLGRLLLPRLPRMLLLRLEVHLEFFVIRPRHIGPARSERSNLATRHDRECRRQIRRKLRCIGRWRLLGDHSSSVPLSLPQEYVFLAAQSRSTPSPPSAVACLDAARALPRVPTRGLRGRRIRKQNVLRTSSIFAAR